MSGETPTESQAEATSTQAEATATKADADATATEAQATGTETEATRATDGVVGAFQTSGVDPLTMGKDIEPAENEGDTVIEGWSSDLESLHPFFAASGPTGAFHALIFENMFVPHPETLEPVGQLAEAWANSDDAMIWSVKLREGITWQDGEPFTANDVKFTYERIMTEETTALAASDLISKLESIEVVDDLTITFTLKQSNADVPLDVGSSRIVAEHIWADIAPAHLAFCLSRHRASSRPATERDC